MVGPGSEMGRVIIGRVTMTIVTKWYYGYGDLLWLDIYCYTVIHVVPFSIDMYRMYIDCVYIYIIYNHL